MTFPSRAAVCVRVLLTALFLTVVGAAEVRGQYEGYAMLLDERVETDEAAEWLGDVDGDGIADGLARGPAQDDAPAVDEPAAAAGFQDKLNEIFGDVNGWVGAVFFWDVIFWDNSSENAVSLPLAVIWLVLGAIFFTLRMRFINVRGFAHAIAVTRGKYSNPRTRARSATSRR